MKNLILKLHNTKRNLVAGGGVSNHSAACRMATMQWDEELAKLAVLNVKQCKMNHDLCHNTKKFPLSGQSLAYKSFYGKIKRIKLVKYSIQMWYDEFKDSNMTIINSFPANYTGP